MPGARPTPAAPPAPDPRCDSLFLDLDGTLAEIAPSPDAAALHPEAAALLPRLVPAFSGRVAVVSGRSIDTLERMLPPAALAAGLALAGTHGLEVRSAGATVAGARPAPGLAAAGRALAGLVSADSRLLVEDKRLSVALHYRGAPEREAELRKGAARIAAECGLSVQTGKMVVELRTPGPDKGGAVRRLMREPPFAGSKPWVIGDDDTDEAGFAAAADLGGQGIRVGPASQTCAPFRLADVSAVTAWLTLGLAG